MSFIGIRLGDTFTSPARHVFYREMPVSLYLGKV